MATVYLSYAFLGLMAAVIAAVAAVAVTVLRMKSKKDLSPSGTGPSQPGSARCPNCGAPTDASMAFCENCGTKLH